MSDTACDSPMEGEEYSPEYVGRLLQELEATLSQPSAWCDLSMDELTGVAETLARLNARSDKSLLQLLDSLVCNKEEYIESRNLSKLLNSYAHLGFLEGNLIAASLKTRASFADADPGQVSSIMFSLGKLKLTLSEQSVVASMGLTNAELNQVLQRLCSRAMENIDRFSSLEISTIVFAMARLSYRNTKLLHLFADVLGSRAAEATPQVVSNTIYAMGKLGFKSISLLDAVCTAAPSRLDLFKPQEIANLVYAFGQLEYRNESFLMALGDHVPSRLQSFKPQELSITAYAYSQLRVGHPRLFSGIAIQIARRIDECSPQAISNTVYAMSKVNFRHNGLLTAMALSLPGRLHELTPQHVSNIMYAFGKLGHRDEVLLNAICSHVPLRLWEFRPQNIANTVYATGKLGFRHDGLLGAVAVHLPTRLNECVSQDISNIIYSFGLLGYRSDKLFASVEVYVRTVLVPRGMQQKDLSYLMSAFRKAGIEYRSDESSPKEQQRPVIVLNQLIEEEKPEDPLSSLVDELDQVALACNVDLLKCLLEQGA